MGLIRLALLFADREYALTLASALSERWRAASVFVVSPCSTDEFPTVDFVICDTYQVAESYGARGIYLYEEEQGDSIHVASVAMYQPLRGILAQLRSICEHDQSTRHIQARNSKDTIFIGVTSGSGGVGTSSTAVALGRILSRLHSKRTIYITFERAFTTDYASPYKHSGFFVDKLLYKIVSDGPGCAKSLVDYTVKDSYDLCYLPTCGDINPLATASEDDIFDFMQALSTWGGYERVVLDVPYNFRHWKAVMRMCEKQIVNYGFRKHCHLASDIVKADLSELCALDDIDPTNRIMALNTLFDEDSFTISEDGFDIDIHGQFGAEVRALADILENE